MSEVTKNNAFGIEIFDYTGESYKTAMSYGHWRVAYLNHGDVFDEENFEKIERHLETDEVFMLLEGEATLIVGKELNRIRMEEHKVYNIPRGVWHHIFTKPGTRVFIVENEDTGLENSEYFYVNSIASAEI